jgi:hypothetical protein
MLGKGNAFPSGSAGIFTDLTKKPTPSHLGHFGSII